MAVWCSRGESALAAPSADCKQEYLLGENVSSTIQGAWTRKRWWCSAQKVYQKGPLVDQEGLPPP